MLPEIVNHLTQSQIDQINKTMQTGGRLVTKPTRKQVEGGFLGTLASIGIPVAIELVSKMLGKGLQVDKTPNRCQIVLRVSKYFDSTGYYTYNTV